MLEECEAGKEKDLISKTISKFLKIVKAPSLRSDKGSVFGCYLAGTGANYPLQLFANGIFVIF